MASATGRNGATHCVILPPFPPLEPNADDPGPGRESSGSADGRSGRSTCSPRSSAPRCSRSRTSPSRPPSRSGGDLGNALATPPLPWVWVLVGFDRVPRRGRPHERGVRRPKDRHRPRGGVHFSSTLDTQFVPWTAFRRPMVDQGRLGATVIYVREGRSGPRTSWMHLPHDQAEVLASHPTFARVAVRQRLGARSGVREDRGPIPHLVWCTSQTYV